MWVGGEAVIGVACAMVPSKGLALTRSTLYFGDGVGVTRDTNGRSDGDRTAARSKLPGERPTQQQESSGGVGGLPNRED